eukprot:TRINITY_DN2862_c0_g1_i2.p1 TRINITY_DN2862_c0_g1~~TRINITY_DN2862_c0_g1_i2.p1  ORF type:complete len:160 (-),score=39.50 TRINITY_DN2862_c0_g1_i2:59-475(-)
MDYHKNNSNKLNSLNQTLQQKRHILLILQFLVCFFICFYFKPTSFDFTTYMEQMEVLWTQKQFDYNLIGGFSGPLVYPAGHVYIYTLFWFFASKPINFIYGRILQFTFIILYLITSNLFINFYYQTKVIEFMIIYDNL